MAGDRHAAESAVSTKAFFVLDERTSELRQMLEDSPARAEFERRFLMSWIHHENALEGLVLDEHEITQALEHHVVADPASMSGIVSIRAHRKAFEAIREEARSRRAKITLPLLEDLYHTLLEGSHVTEKEKAVYRNEMPLHRVYFHDFHPPEQIQRGLEVWLKRIAGPEFKEQHPVRQAANAHWHFMQVFPFAQHNGRIARLVQAFFLLKAGYMPPIIHARDRQPYYEALRHSAASLRGLLVDAMESSLENSQRFVRAITTGNAAS